MKTSRRFVYVASTLSLTLGGCVSKGGREAFSPVQQTISDRLGMRVRWNQGTKADQDADEAIKQLLSQPLSAEQAVQVALLNNPQLQATYEEIGIAQAQLVQAGLLSNPVFDFTPRWPTKSGLRFSYEANVVADFLDLLLMPLHKRMAEANLLAAQMRVSHEVIETATGVRRTYYQLVAARQMAEMQRTVADAADASADAAQALRTAGNLTELAVAQEQTQAAQARLDWAAAQAEADQLREELAARMGLWGVHDQWSIADRLPDPPAGEDFSAGELESLAVANRLDLAAAKQEITSLAQEAGLTNASRFPFSVGAYAEKEPEPHGATLLGPSFELTLPLFDQGQGWLAEVKARWRRATAAYASMAVQVRSEIRRAELQLTTTRARARFYRQRMLPLQQQVVEQTQLQYNAMQIGVFDLLRARHEQMESGGEYVRSLREYWIARAELERAAGGSLVARPSSQSPTAAAQQAQTHTSVKAGMP